MDSLSSRIEHTLLQPLAGLSDYEQLVKDAIKHGFYGVCVPPYFVRPCRDLLVEMGFLEKVKLISVAGFPFGYSSAVSKVEDIKRMIDDGVDEVDGVINLAAFRSGFIQHVKHDMESMVRVVHLKGKKIKIILEVNILTDSELEQLMEMALLLDVNFIKTSTGVISQDPITAEKIKFMKNFVGDRCMIKASGGIRTKEQALSIIEAGADRLGTSNSISIIGK
jgi:deoxyribose-phosphate aldolase